MYSYCYISVCMMEMMGKFVMYDVIYVYKVICIIVYDQLLLNCYVVIA